MGWGWEWGGGGATEGGNCITLFPRWWPVNRANQGRVELTLLANMESDVFSRADLICIDLR